MTQQTLPDGYGVLHADDGYWYPVEIRRYYSAEHPEETMSVMILWSQITWDARYKHRKEAVAHALDYAAREQDWQNYKWEQLAQYSEVYPERCSHYLDE